MGAAMTNDQGRLTELRNPLFRLRRIHQREDVLLLRLVIERVEKADFVDPARAVQGIEKERVLLGQFGGLKVAAAQVRIRIGMRRMAREKVEAQPAAVGARDL